MSSFKNNGAGKQLGRRMVLARRVTLAAVLVAVLISLAFDSGLGTPSAFGVREFFLLCPLGGIEAMVASKSFIPVAAISMAVVLVFALLFGRAWCAWGCPAPVIRRFFKRQPRDSDETGAALTSGRGMKAAPSGSARLPHSPESRRAEAPCAVATGVVSSLKHIARDTRTWALAAVVVAVLIAGFPIFCLVCPIGLTFGTVGSLWHLVVDKQMTMSVIVFPLALAVELVLYRKWCLNLCPIAGLLGIAGQFARLFRPRVNAQTCLRYRDGVNCNVCTAACSERIDLHRADAPQKLGECTRCGECAAQCPTASIALGLMPSDPVVHADEMGS